MATPSSSSSSIDELLPVDITETILSRLPVKSLLRFKTVSKSWHALISHPQFSRIHHHHHIQHSLNNNIFLMWAYTSPHAASDNFSLIKLENQKFRTETEFEIPFAPATPLCSFNGILLLASRSCKTHDVYILWNPSIKKYARITSPLKPHNHQCSFGLYHDSITDYYKVVINSEEFYTVYSCKNASWAETKPLPFNRNGLKYPQKGMIFVDGSFYWYTVESHKREMVCFDVRDEKLHKFPQPNGLKSSANETDDEVFIADLSGRLCLYHVNRDETKLQLWVMEKKHLNSSNCYSWKELMNMEKEEPDLFFIHPMCLTNEDNVVIKLRSPEIFVVYNRCEKSFKKLEVCWNDLYDIFPYSESLYFPIQNIRAAEEEARD